MCEGGLEGLVSGLGQNYPFGTNSDSLPCTTMCLGRLLRTFFGGYGTHPSSEYHRVLTTLTYTYLPDTPLPAPPVGTRKGTYVFYVT